MRVDVRIQQSIQPVERLLENRNIEWPSAVKESVQQLVVSVKLLAGELEKVRRVADLLRGRP